MEKMVRPVLASPHPVEDKRRVLVTIVHSSLAKATDVKAVADALFDYLFTAAEADVVGNCDPLGACWALLGNTARPVVAGMATEGSIAIAAASVGAGNVPASAATVLRLQVLCNVLRVADAEGVAVPPAATADLTDLATLLRDTACEEDTPAGLAAGMAFLCGRMAVDMAKPREDVVKACVAWLGRLPEGPQFPDALSDEVAAVLALLQGACATDALWFEAVAAMFAVLIASEQPPSNALSLVLLHAVEPVVARSLLYLKDNNTAFNDTMVGTFVSRMLRWKFASDVLSSRVTNVIRVFVAGNRFRPLATGVAATAASFCEEAASKPSGWLKVVFWLGNCPGTMPGTGLPGPRPAALLPHLTTACKAVLSTGPRLVSPALAANVMDALVTTMPELRRDADFAAAHGALRAAAGKPSRPSDTLRLCRTVAWTCGTSPDLGSLAGRAASGVGLANLGNTCYMNSVLQALFATTRLQVLLLGEQPREAGKPPPPLLTALRVVLGELALSYRPFVAPVKLHSLLPAPFTGYAQQDATEFCRMLVDAMATGTPKGRHRAALEGVFGGVGATVVRCNTCRSTSVNRETFTDLSVSLSVPDVIGVDVDDAVPLEGLLDRVFAPEAMTGEAMYRCSTCDTKRQATKVLAVTQAPSHLIVTLNRFWFDVSALAQRKILTQVEYPERLSLPVCTDSHAAYDHALGGGITVKRARSAPGPPIPHATTVPYTLYGVVIHVGSTAAHGHYVSYVRDSDTLVGDAQEPAWRRCDDSSVTSMTTAEVLKPPSAGSPNTAYMMLYRRSEEGSPAASEEAKGDDEVEIVEVEPAPQLPPTPPAAIPCDPLLLQAVQRDNSAFLATLEKGTVESAPVRVVSVSRPTGGGAGGAGFSSPRGRFGGGFGGGGPAIF